MNVDVPKRITKQCMSDLLIDELQTHYFFFGKHRGNVNNPDKDILREVNY